jgi:hypothetical protein
MLVLCDKPPNARTMTAVTILPNVQYTVFTLAVNPMLVLCDKPPNTRTMTAVTILPNVQYTVFTLAANPNLDVANMSSMKVAQLMITSQTKHPKFGLWLEFLTSTLEPKNHGFQSRKAKATMH